MKKLICPLFMTAMLSFPSFADDAKDSSPATDTIVRESFDFVPTACSLMDKALCMLDIKNAEWVKEIFKIFIEKKGESIILTTEHFEEVLAKLRELNLSKEDWQSFKTDSKICVEKLHPILEIASKHTEVPLDDAILEQFCSQASSLVATALNLRDIGQIVKNNPKDSLGLAAVVAAFLGSRWYQQGSSMQITGAVAVAYMLMKLSV